MGIDEESLVPSTTHIPLSRVICRVPEAQLKSIVWQTLQAVDFCHKHNVSVCLVWYQCLFRFFLPFAQIRKF